MFFKATFTSLGGLTLYPVLTSTAPAISEEHNEAARGDEAHPEQ